MQTMSRRTSSKLEEHNVFGEAPKRTSLRSVSGRRVSAASDSENENPDLKAFKESISDLGTDGEAIRMAHNAERIVARNKPRRSRARSYSRLSTGDEGSLLRTRIPHEFLEVQQQLDKVGWDQMTWKRGFSLLHWAAQQNDPELCAHFMNLGADPNDRDDDGKNAFDHAKEHHAAAALAELEWAKATVAPLKGSNR